MKKTYNIEVDCANCANIMETKINKLEGITDATVNFMTQKITMSIDDGVDEQAILKAVTKVCKKVDSDFELKL